ncbi:uncharacterized protein LOC114760750 [Neltuma alba]|uniref:uncharacterized protein LOC114760750 n=1 Tax=Neltuma alba TaxID=207710 RepID=UPI0010A44B46|nr:uncharacterized protein LOC114760750 [Prosopis alba]
MSFIAFIFFLLLFGISLFFPTSLLFDPKPHKIHFRFPNLYPEGLAWDPLTQQFFVGSLRQRIIATVSNAGDAKTFVFDSSLPENVTFLGLTVDPVNRRLLAAVHAMEPLPPFDALAAYDLTSGQRIFLSVLPDDDGSVRPIANDVTVDDEGNAYVTNSGGNYIWKVNSKGETSIFSGSPEFTAHPVDSDTPHSYCGLNGIAYVSKGYLLVVQSNTGKMFKVDANDGTARLVQMKQDLMVADDIVLRSDGVVLVVSPVNKLWYLRSEDGWMEGEVYDEIDLDLKRFPTSLVVGKENRTYVVYGNVEEGMMGNSGRESFSIEEVRSKRENRSIQMRRMLVLIGTGLAFFVIWMLQKPSWLVNKGEKVN